MTFPDPQLQPWYFTGEKLYIWDGEKWTLDVNVSLSEDGSFITMNTEYPMVNDEPDTSTPFTMNLDAESIDRIDELVEPTFIGEIQITGPLAILTKANVSDPYVEYDYDFRINGNAIDATGEISIRSEGGFGGEPPILVGENTVRFKKGTSGKLYVSYTVDSALSFDAPKTKTVTVNCASGLSGLDSTPFIDFPKNVRPGSTHDISVGWTNGEPPDLRYKWTFDSATWNNTDFAEFGALVDPDNNVDTVPHAINGADWDFANEWWKCTDRLRMANGSYFEIKFDPADPDRRVQSYFIRPHLNDTNGQGMWIYINTFGETAKIACRPWYGTWDHDVVEIPAAVGFRWVFLPHTPLIKYPRWVLDFYTDDCPAVIQIKDWYTEPNSAYGNYTKVFPDPDLLHISPPVVTQLDDSGRDQRIFFPSHTGLVNVVVRIYAPEDDIDGTSSNSYSWSFNNTIKTYPITAADDELYDRYSMQETSLDENNHLVLAKKPQNNTSGTALNRGEYDWITPGENFNIWKNVPGVTTTLELVFNTQKMKQEGMYSKLNQGWEQPPYRVHENQGMPEYATVDKRYWWCPKHSYVEDPHHMMLGRPSQNNFATFRSPDGSMTSYETDYLETLVKDNHGFAADFNGDNEFETSMLSFRMQMMDRRHTRSETAERVFLVTNENDFDIKLLVVLLSDSQTKTSINSCGRSSASPDSVERGVVYTVTIPANTDYQEVLTDIPINDDNNDAQAIGSGIRTGCDINFVLPAYDGAKIKIHSVMTRDRFHISEGGVWGVDPYTELRSNTYSSDYAVMEVKPGYSIWQNFNVPGPSGEDGFLPGVARDQYNIPIGKGEGQVFEDGVEGWNGLPETDFTSHNKPQREYQKDLFGITPTIEYEDYIEFKFKVEAFYGGKKVDSFTNKDWLKIYTSAKNTPIRCVGRSSEGEHETDIVPWKNQSTGKSDIQYKSFYQQHTKGTNFDFTSIYAKTPAMTYGEGYCSYPQDGADYVGYLRNRYTPKRSLLEEDGNLIPVATGSVVEAPSEEPYVPSIDYENLALSHRYPDRESVALKDLSS